MGRKLDDILDSLPRTRRESIEGRASKISEEMTAASLHGFRREATSLARKPGPSQRGAKLKPRT